jgi:hypothetical protein
VVDAESGPADAQQGGNDVVAHVAELGETVGLRIGHQQRLELVRFLAAHQGEIDRGGQWACRLDHGETRARLTRAAGGLVEVGELGQARRRGAHYPLRGLDDERAVAGLDGQGPGAVGSREGDIAAVRDHHAGNAAVAAAARTGAPRILVHHATHQHRIAGQRAGRCGHGGGSGTG